MNQRAFDQPNPISSSDNLALAIVGGAAAALAGAAVWAVVTVTTGYQIGWMAVGVGFLVGLTVRKLGNGRTAKFGIAGAVLALAGCLAGNALAIVGFMAQVESAPFLATLNQVDTSVLGSLMVETAGPMDLLFYAIAIYEGFRLSMLPAEAPAAGSAQP